MEGKGLRTKRPENSRPKMSNIDRAKQFAPFAALGRLGEAFAYIERQMNIGELETVPELQELLAENTDIDISDDIIYDENCGI